MTKTIVDPTAVPTWVSDIELTEPIADLKVPSRPELPYQQTRLLVRLDRAPVGYVTFDVDDSGVLPAGFLAEEIWDALGGEVSLLAADRGIDISGGLSLDGLQAPARAVDENPPFISVVLCTRNRPEGACATVADLLNLEYSNFEIIVIDNAPASDATKRGIEERFDDSRIRYFREGIAGLSHARNRGVAEARGEIIAFTDDDVRVDKWWLAGIRKGFAEHDDVGCVTGPVPSAQLDNAIQHYFDRRITWSTLVRPRVFDMKNHKDDSILYPFSPGIFGTGANFAFEAATIKAAGGFDAALGAGSPSGGGEDLDAFLKVLLMGKVIVQEPSAIVWHVHRSSVDQLSEQMFYYGVGLSAFIWKYLTSPHTSTQVLRRIGPGLVKLAGISSRSANEANSGTLPRSVLAKELLGMAYGPVAYLRGRAAEAQLVRNSMRSGNPVGAK